MKEIEKSRQSRRGDAEGVAGAECERGLNRSRLGGLGSPPREFVKSCVLSPAI